VHVTPLAVTCTPLQGDKAGIGAKFEPKGGLISMCDWAFKEGRGGEGAMLAIGASIRVPKP